MYERYGDRVEFLGVYVREAHPVDGWRNQVNDRAGISFEQPTNREGRVTLARLCTAHLELTMPLLVDELDDRVGHAYSGMPDRLYLIDRDGKVAYKGGRGPFGFSPRDLEQSLVMLLLDQDEAGVPSPARPAASRRTGRARPAAPRSDEAGKAPKTPREKG